MLDAAGLTKFSNSPALSGQGQGQVTRRKAKSTVKERDERPTRKRIRDSRRPLNYRKDGLQNRTDQPNSPVIKKPVMKKGIPKPTKFRGRIQSFGASRS